jgi:hypothetical protein
MKAICSGKKKSDKLDARILGCGTVPFSVEQRVRHSSGRTGSPFLMETGEGTRRLISLFG